MNPETGEVPLESPKLSELAKALAKAQGSMSPASKDSDNPVYRSKYADLASVWEAIRKPLAENGLSVTQRVTTSKEGVTVSTMLLHSSGEFVEDSCWLPVLPQTTKEGKVLPISAQSYGSAITYARRYSLSAMVGVAAEEDDDGNAASGRAVASAKELAKARAEAEPALVRAGDAIDASEAEARRQVGPNPTNGEGFVLDFGKHKGKALSEIESGYLRWLVEQAEGALNDPAKERHRAKNMQILALVRAEVSRRSRED